MKWEEIRERRGKNFVRAARMITKSEIIRIRRRVNIPGNVLGEFRDIC